MNIVSKVSEDSSVKIPDYILKKTGLSQVVKSYGYMMMTRARYY